jgi:hypothetical protein
MERIKKKNKLFAVTQLLELVGSNLSMDHFCVLQKKLEVPICKSNIEICSMVCDVTNIFGLEKVKFITKSISV